MSLVPRTGHPTSSPSTSGVSATAALPADTRLGAVRLNVADISGTRAFYERVIGLARPDGPGPIVELVSEPDAPRRPPGSTGLFHVAILVESRVELARALARVARAGWPLSGASDHLVSEALYLTDPERNGIEIYRDRPRDEWPRLDGQLQMATRPLDLDGLLAELSASASESESGTGTGTETETETMAPSASIGHVHLQVADLAAAERFYHDVLGFDVTVRGYPGALFLSAGGYHHHIGVNTWAGEGAPAAPPGALGLRSFEVIIPGRDELAEVARRVRSAGIDVHDDAASLRLADPSGNQLLLKLPASVKSA